MTGGGPAGSTDASIRCSSSTSGSVGRAAVSKAGSATIARWLAAMEHERPHPHPCPAAGQRSRALGGSRWPAWNDMLHVLTLFAATTCGRCVRRRWALALPGPGDLYPGSWLLTLCIRGGKIKIRRPGRIFMSEVDPLRDDRPPDVGKALLLEVKRTACSSPPRSQ